MKKVTTAKKASELRSLIADRKLFFWSSQVPQVDTDKKKYGSPNCVLSQVNLKSNSTKEPLDGSIHTQLIIS